MSQKQIQIQNGWKIKTLEEVCSSIKSGFAQGNKNVANGVIHLRMNNIGVDFKLNFELVRTIGTNEKQLENYKLKPNDVIFNNTNSTDLVGKSVIFNEKKNMSFQ